MRETDEEVGLKASIIDIPGKLPLEMTVRDVLIFSWVGRIDLPYNFIAGFCK